jgi:hypothetical protein
MMAAEKGEEVARVLIFSNWNYMCSHLLYSCYYLVSLLYILKLFEAGYFNVHVAHMTRLAS